MAANLTTKEKNKVINHRDEKKTTKKMRFFFLIKIHTHTHKVLNNSLRAIFYLNEIIRDIVNNVWQPVVVVAENGRRVPC